MYFDPMYFLFALPALLLGMWAQFRVSSAFGKYSEVGTRSGMTGAQAARRILDYNGLQNVAVCLLYTSPSPRDGLLSRMPSSA